MVSINTNLSSLIVQQNLAKSTNALDLAIERLTTGFKINHASDNAANYSIANSYDSKISSYVVAQDNTAMGADMLGYADDILNNMSSNASRLRELCVQAQNGTYGKQSIQAIKAEAGAIVSQITNLYQTAEYNGINLFDIYSDRLAEMQANSATPATPIGLSSDISADNDGFIVDPHTYTDEQVEAMTSLSTVEETDTISSGTYSIATAEDLAKLAQMTNDGLVSGGTFVLANDVDLSAWCADHTATDGTGGWTAIGTSSYQFKGTFDGNGHKVSGLYINKTTGYQGLFGNTANDSSLKNVGVENVDVIGKKYTGGLVGEARGTITNCYVIGSVSSGTAEYAGGLAGRTMSAIKNSYSKANVNGLGQIGGL